VAALMASLRSAAAGRAERAKSRSRARAASRVVGTIACARYTYMRSAQGRQPAAIALGSVRLLESNARQLTGGHAWPPALSVWYLDDVVRPLRPLRTSRAL
jgi:hypothetical protein